MERLPVEDVIDDVRAALAGRGVAVLTAEPGAGKTTVVPLRLLDHTPGRIVVLEPRRVATRAAARRMAATLGERVGETVGYRTRDDHRTGPNTRIEVVTEGILTRRLQTDRSLAGTGLVVFDEFHERNQHGDLGLALALDARRTHRPDLRILVMSATLDVARVAALLGDAPVITSEGRTHPVDVRWLPKPKTRRLEEAVADAVVRALREQDDGDVLVFLPGMADLRRAATALASANANPGVDVHLLHGSLPSDEQDAALAPSATGARKVILSTDIAESSLTVEGVTAVVDAGLARVPRFDAGTSMTRLKTIGASKASTDQRAGRAGRTRPGIAYRLWSKMEHAARQPHGDPEIAHVDLADLALELATWGVDDPADLPFLDQPPRRALGDARALLRMLGAIDEANAVTDAGRDMSGLPLHPRLAHMVVESIVAGRGWVACVAATLLEDEQPLQPLHARPRAFDLAHRVGVSTDEPLDERDVGQVVALAYPDRIARGRGGGQFSLPSGLRLWLAKDDPLADAPFLVVARTDGHRKNPRILAAAWVQQDHD